MATNTNNISNLRSSTSSPSFAYSGSAYVGCFFPDTTTNFMDPRLTHPPAMLQLPMQSHKILVSPSPSPRIPQGSAATSWANTAPLLSHEDQSMEAGSLPAPSLLRCSSQFLVIDEDEEDENLQNLALASLSGEAISQLGSRSAASRASDHSLYCLSVVDDASGLTREATPEEAWKVNEILIMARHEVHLERAEAAAKAATAHNNRRRTLSSFTGGVVTQGLYRSEEGDEAKPRSLPPASASFTMPSGSLPPPPLSSRPFVDHAAPMVASQGGDGGEGAACFFSSHRKGGPCDHCGATESPQWRRGPIKTPTLCNACGMRFRRTNSLGLPPPPPPPVPSDVSAKAAHKMKLNALSLQVQAPDEVLEEAYHSPDAPSPIPIPSPAQQQIQIQIQMQQCTVVSSPSPRVTKRSNGPQGMRLPPLAEGHVAPEDPAAYKRVKRTAAIAGVAQLTAALLNPSHLTAI